MSKHFAQGVLGVGIALLLIGCQSSINSPTLARLGNLHSALTDLAQGNGDADPFKLADAAPENFAVLGLGSPTNVSITGPSRIFGKVANVGVAGASKFR